VDIDEELTKLRKENEKMQAEIKPRFRRHSRKILKQCKAPWHKRS
jgi:hypothetical protein